MIGLSKKGYNYSITFREVRDEMKSKYILTHTCFISLELFGLHSRVFLPVPPGEIDELHYCVDEIAGDGYGLE